MPPRNAPGRTLAAGRGYGRYGYGVACFSWLVVSLSERKEQEMTENGTGAGRRGRFARDTVTGKFLSPEVAAGLPAKDVVWDHAQVCVEHAAMWAVLELIADGHEHPTEFAAETLALLKFAAGTLALLRSEGTEGTEGTGEGL